MFNLWQSRFVVVASKKFLRGNSQIKGDFKNGLPRRFHRLAMTTHPQPPPQGRGAFKGKPSARQGAFWVKVEFRVPYSVICMKGQKMTKLQSPTKQSSRVSVKTLAKQDLSTLISQVDEEQQALLNKAKLCIFHSIVHINALDEFVLKREGRFFDAIAKFLGFYKLCENPDSYLKDESVRKKVLHYCEFELELLQRCEKQGKLVHKTLQENFAYLQDAFGLSKSELSLLEFVVMKNEILMFKNFFRMYDDLSVRECIMMIAKIIQTPYDELKAALQNNAKLRKSGILRMSANRSDVVYFLDFENENFADALLEKSCDTNSLMGEIVEPCEYSTLTKQDYAHIKEFDMLQNYLKIAISQGKSGVNVLFYGSPGTGKTELAKLLAKGANALIYKVRTMDKYGEVLDGECRLNSYTLAQRLLTPKKSLLIYDEVEDILCFSNDENRLKNKAFINESLENNAVASIWITNNIHNVDNAVIRRFDFVLNVKVPKIAHRKRILQRICKDKIDEKTLNFASKIKLLSPAIIERANKVSSCLDGNFCENFKTLTKNTLKASYVNLNLKKHKKDDKIELPQSYSLEFINADYDLEALADGILQNPNARLCFYGASGTGKSAYARFLAQKLGRKCLVKPVSELFDCLVGNTEKNIAATFKEASEKNAVLVFDEADSFLRERNLAKQSWEQTLVNETLVQMENFKGVFIATTNLMDSLDKACLRRFDLKLEFRVLTPLQRVKLFEKECALLGISCGENVLLSDENELLRDETVLSKVKRLENLSSGDFAAVKRLSKSSPLKNALDFYERLADEVRVKDLQNENSRVGFGV